MKIELSQTGGGVDFYNDTFFSVRIDGTLKYFNATPENVLDIVLEELIKCHKLVK